ncbi:MAG: hypothetical protein JOZ13_13760 [Alphaproteobacteria bacterium]|nr:hypothetical protein [Alphaproteobacteria bacterium]
MRRVGLLVCLVLGACTHARTLMLDDRRAIISGSGSMFNEQADVMQKTLVTAAYTTITHGYRYFTILGSKDTTIAGVFHTPTQTYASGDVSGGSWSATATTVGGNDIPYVVPGMDIVIYMYRDGEAQRGPKVWDARAIIDAQPKERKFP